MRKLWYMGLEPYEGRYTLQLQQWSEKVFQRRGIDYEVVHGDILDNSKSIVTGQVLDAHGRSFYSLTQMAQLVRKMKAGEITGEDVIFFEDMFTPGIEALPYIMDQCPTEFRPMVYVRCLAQTIDPDDFLHVWHMDDWMRKYEQMLLPWVTVLASNEEMVAHMKIAGWDVPIYNISGLAFDKEEVRSRVLVHRNFFDRPQRVVFAARFDQEKQPHWFMDLIETAHALWAKCPEFVVASGGPFRSNDHTAIDRARRLEQEGKLVIRDNLSKNEYYEILGNSRVLFNCALQDWVSNTASEADALGTNCVYPAYRSFPETFSNDHTRLYVPWSIDDALDKLNTALRAPNENMGKLSDWTSGTIDRCIDIMRGEAWELDRNRLGYRKFANEHKY